ncbi:MAG: FAD-dependent monooxygenase, partial [Phycisphaerales bacterium]|nr:FAD-dependent monooxygenase [Phycisphaerales bacterium]
MPTADLDNVAIRRNDVWPVVIIGAGPAGAAAAIHLARAGVRTLLLDRAHFPRDTVCGCCLNPNALAHLDRLDVLQDVLRAGATEIDHLTLHAFRRSMSCALPGGRALSRRTLDAILVNAAREAGAEFRSGVSAHISPDRSALRNGVRRIATSAGSIAAATVIIADGLHGSSLRALPVFRPHIAAGSRIGIAAHLPDASLLAPHELSMACSAHGYVGLVRLEDGTLDCAAAVDPAWLRAQPDPAHAVQRLWNEA